MTRWGDSQRDRDALDAWITREPPEPPEPYHPDCAVDCQLPCDCLWPNEPCAMLDGTGGTDVTGNGGNTP